MFNTINHLYSVAGFYHDSIQHRISISGYTEGAGGNDDNVFWLDAPCLELLLKAIDYVETAYQGITGYDSCGKYISTKGNR